MSWNELRINLLTPSWNCVYAETDLADVRILTIIPDTEGPILHMADLIIWLKAQNATIVDSQDDIVEAELDDIALLILLNNLKDVKQIGLSFRLSRKQFRYSEWTSFLASFPATWCLSIWDPILERKLLLNEIISTMTDISQFQRYAINNRWST
ncbi:MAG: hypothetical protein R3B84_22355 [Zavarzinella sp.]